MLSQLSKLATKLDRVGLTKEADVLDAFIKRAAKKNQTDGEWAAIPEHWHDKRTEYSNRTPYRYHPGPGDEADFDKWINDNIDRSDGIMSSVRRQSDNGPKRDFDYDSSDFADDGIEWQDGEGQQNIVPADGSDIYSPEREYESGGDDREILIGILNAVGADSSGVVDLTDDDVEAMIATCRDLIPR